MAFIIGDIHGCLSHLEELLEMAAIDPYESIITLGDYIDRGPDSMGVIQKLIDLNDQFEVISLLGNHDKFMLDARHHATVHEFWLNDYVGGQATLDSYGGTLASVPQSHWEFLEGCPLYHELDDWICAHGGVDPATAMPRQKEQTLLNLRFHEARAHVSGKKVICGHTRQLDGMPKWQNHSLCIDTHAFGGGFLTGFDSKRSILYQVDNKGQRRTFSLQDIINR